MRTCHHADCSEWIGREFYFCPTHRDSDYAFEFRLENGLPQP